MRRRTAIAGLVLFAAPFIAVRAIPRRDDGFAFSDIPGLPGFRRLESGEVSAPRMDPLLGLRLPDAPPPPRPLAPAELCAALFGAAPSPGAVMVASFSDYYCPYCRDLTARLAGRAGTDVAVVWHELPILGTASVAAARAALAADMQGAYAAFQARLLRTSFQPNDAYLTEVGGSLGLDTARLLADARGPEVARRLETSARAAATLGIAATPALVVGRTLVSGAIPDSRLDALLAVERAEGPGPC